MANFHLSGTICSRSNGSSAVASAAYNSGDRITNERTGITSDYTNKKGVVYSEIMLPKNAPASYADRSTLWNSVEAKEKGSRAQMARKIEMSLPREVSDREDQIEMVRSYCQEQFVDQGMVADFSIHDKGDGNPHAHILLTMRAFTDNGEWAPKAHNVYRLDSEGNRIPALDKDGNQKRDKGGALVWERDKISYTDWDNKDNMEKWRAAWADTCNDWLDRVDAGVTVDHRSYKRQGLDIEPTLHVGPVEWHIHEKDPDAYCERIEQNKMIVAFRVVVDKIKSGIESIRIRLNDLILGRIQDIGNDRKTDVVTGTGGDLETEARPRGSGAAAERFDRVEIEPALERGGNPGLGRAGGEIEAGPDGADAPGRDGGADRGPSGRVVRGTGPSIEPEAVDTGLAVGDRSGRVVATDDDDIDGGWGIDGGL